LAAEPIFGASKHDRELHQKKKKFAFGCSKKNSNLILDSFWAINWKISNWRGVIGKRNINGMRGEK